MGSAKQIGARRIRQATATIAGVGVAVTAAALGLTVSDHVGSTTAATTAATSTSTSSTTTSSTTDTSATTGGLTAAQGAPVAHSAGS
ncbi:hypothetical protein [Arsenicicoccus sp. oral taxon 190]|uniref:hypothetical protein n=1 Tax=Arsenicicoccus sp. oral taxon 190 TaxID=1658671 RepID=UPI0012E0E6C9|nr:hypothetical protein [Arsenicicoccus sp. oral taxon 190]